MLRYLQYNCLLFFFLKCYCLLLNKLKSLHETSTSNKIAFIRTKCELVNGNPKC